MLGESPASGQLCDRPPVQRRRSGHGECCHPVVDGMLAGTPFAGLRGIGHNVSSPVRTERSRTAPAGTDVLGLTKGLRSDVLDLRT